MNIPMNTWEFEWNYSLKENLVIYTNGFIWYAIWDTIFLLATITFYWSINLMIDTQAKLSLNFKREPGFTHVCKLLGCFLIYIGYITKYLLNLNTIQHISFGWRHWVGFTISVVCVIITKVVYKTLQMCKNCKIHSDS